MRNLLAQHLPRAFLGQSTISQVISDLRPRLDVLMAQNQDIIRQLVASGR